MDGWNKVQVKSLLLKKHSRNHLGSDSTTPLAKAMFRSSGDMDENDIG
jgi:hypothetical protein